MIKEDGQDISEMRSEHGNLRVFLNRDLYEDEILSIEQELLDAGVGLTENIASDARILGVSYTGGCPNYEISECLQKRNLRILGWQTIGDDSIISRMMESLKALF